jgi:hypothetical protein
MLDRIEDKGQSYVIFSVRDSLAGNETYEVKDFLGKTITAYTPENSFSNLVVSSEAISENGTYTLWQGERQIAESMAGMKSFGGPGGFGGPGPGEERPEKPEGFERPDQDGERPEKPEWFEGFEPDQRPEGFESGKKLMKSN